jgi:hypothetical protein
MSDIVERLRAPSVGTTEWGHIALHGEAAAEITRLRVEVEEQARLLGMSGEREAKLLARVEELEYGNSKAMAALAALSGVQQDAGPP